MKNETNEPETTETVNEINDQEVAAAEPETEAEAAPVKGKKKEKKADRKYVLYSLTCPKPSGTYVGLAVVDEDVSYGDTAAAALARLKSFTKLTGKRGPVVDFMREHPTAEFTVNVIGKPAANKEEATARKVKAIAKLGATLNGRKKASE